MQLQELMTELGRKQRASQTSITLWPVLMLKSLLFVTRRLLTGCTTCLASAESFLRPTGEIGRR